MSQTDLADQVGVSFQQIQKYEKGTNRISCGTLSEMAEALDCPIAFFFSAEKELHTEMNLTGNLGQGPTNDDRRLITAFGKMEKSKRKKVVSLAESMVHAKG